MTEHCRIIALFGPTTVTQNPRIPYDFIQLIWPPSPVYDLLSKADVNELQFPHAVNDLPASCGTSQPCHIPPVAQGALKMIKYTLIML